MDGTEILLIVAKSVTLVFGGLVTYLTVMAYRRTGAAALAVLALAIGLLVAGALVGGLLHQILGLTLETSVGVQSMFTAVGFATLAYSLYAREPGAEGRTSSGRGFGRSGN